MALDRLDRGDEALARLAEAMALAAPAGWVRPFVEAGTPMADLMTKLPEQPEHARFTQRVRAAHEAFRKSARRESPSPRQAEQPLIEPLTNRELDVLEHLVRRLQDKEIAESLSVSVGTVKTHLKHIYGKLAVSGRRAAVVKAEELGVI